MVDLIVSWLEWRVDSIGLAHARVNTLSEFTLLKKIVQLLEISSLLEIFKGEIAELLTIQRVMPSLNWLMYFFFILSLLIWLSQPSSFMR